MQTHEWEALLDGTTPGPWEAREDHGGMNLFAGGERVFVSDSCGDVYGADEDVRLAAHAPAAVAEVVRLRREVAAFRDHMAKSAERHKAMYGGVDDAGHLLDAEYDRQVAYVLTRILEGGTDD